MSEWENSISSTKKGRYIPAMGYDLLTPLYDPIMRITGLTKIQRALIRSSDVQAGDRVLDVGCGTGSLLAMLKETEPDSDLYGLDGDGSILGIARRKAARRSLSIRLDEGMSYKLPYPDASFDRVLSSLMLHHISTTDKRRTFREIFRVLKPGGLMMIADFGPAQNRIIRLLSGVVMRRGHVSDNLEGLLPSFAQEAGFVDVETLDHFNMIFGTIWIFRGKKSHLSKSRTTYGK